MQATRYVPDEIEQCKSQREPSSFKADMDFASEVLGEKRGLTQPQVMAQGQTIFHDLLVFTSDRSWIFLVWALEIFWLLFVTTACAMEMWGACAFELGSAFFCTYCYSSEFLTFLGVLVVLWTFNMYTYVLLLSRGFQLKLRFLGLTVQRNKDKGIPGTALYLFMFLSTAMFLWLLVGLVMLFTSSTCLRSGMIYGNRPGRSQLMFYTTIATLIIMPTLFFMGRCDDAKGVTRKIWA